METTVSPLAAPFGVPSLGTRDMMRFLATSKGVVVICAMVLEKAPRVAARRGSLGLPPSCEMRARCQRLVLTELVPVLPGYLV